MKLQKILVTIAVGGMVFPLSTAFAQSSTPAMQLRELQDQIVRLQEQVKNLETQKKNAHVWCNTFRGNLQSGDQSPDVFALGITLSKENLGVGLTEGRPAFDGLVLAAVKQFQKKYGIPQTGFVGPLTRGKLNSLYACEKV